MRCLSMHMHRRPAYTSMMILLLTTVLIVHVLRMLLLLVTSSSLVYHTASMVSLIIIIHIIILILSSWRSIVKSHRPSQKILSLHLINCSLCLVLDSKAQETISFWIASNRVHDNFSFINWRILFLKVWQEHRIINIGIKISYVNLVVALRAAWLWTLLLLLLKWSLVVLLIILSIGTPEGLLDTTTSVSGPI